MQIKLNIHSVAVRLVLSFVGILALFAATLLVTLRTLDEVEAAEVHLGRLDHAKHLGHNAANSVRELYIHQAHTLIEWDDSHLTHYSEAVDRARDLTRRLSQLDLTGDNKLRAGKIGQLAMQVDSEFKKSIIPVVRAQPRGSMPRLHDRIEHMVNEVIQLNEQLNRDLEAESDRARKYAEEQRTEAKLMVIGCCGLAILIAALVAFLLVRSILRPIDALRRAAGDVAKGNFGVRIEPLGKGEFAQLASSFNQMVSDLKSHQERLLHTHRLASIGQLAAGVAHEVNNPLGVILGYIKLLKRDAPESMREDLQIVEDEASQCQAIVKALLELAKPDSLVKEETDLGQVARECAEHLVQSEEYAGREIALPENQRVLVSADAGRIRQVVANLLSNALQSSAEARAEVRIGDRDGEVFISVSDNGPGMSPEVQERIMEPFYTTKPKGTGLGLAISQNIVDAHGGRLEVESGPDNGTCVTLWLPKRAARNGA